jgi:propanediol utilization protein
LPIMKIMGHSSVTVSQRYVHPTPESMERAFERLETLNKEKRDAARPKRAAGEQRVPSISLTVKNKRGMNPLQLVDNK